MSRKRKQRLIQIFRIMLAYLAHGIGDYIANMSAATERRRWSTIIFSNSCESALANEGEKVRRFVSCKKNLSEHGDLCEQVPRTCSRGVTGVSDQSNGDQFVVISAQRLCEVADAPERSRLCFRVDSELLNGLWTLEWSSLLSAPTRGLSEIDNQAYLGYRTNVITQIYGGKLDEYGGTPGTSK